MKCLSTTLQDLASAPVVFTSGVSDDVQRADGVSSGHEHKSLMKLQPYSGMDTKRPWHRGARAGTKIAFNYSSKILTSAFQLSVTARRIEKIHHGNA